MAYGVHCLSLWPEKDNFTNSNNNVNNHKGCSEDARSYQVNIQGVQKNAMEIQQAVVHHKLN